jgi:hypothetical protein
MSEQNPVDCPDDEGKDTTKPRRHPITMSNSREETIRRMQAFPERAAKFRERLREMRVSRTEKDS